jgi:hypothetical protein
MPGFGSEVNSRVTAVRDAARYGAARVADRKCAPWRGGMPLSVVSSISSSDVSGANVVSK